MRKMMLLFSMFALAILAPATLTHATVCTESDEHVLKIELSGGAEKPGPGDPDGSGWAVLTLNHEKGEVCYDITVKDIQDPTAAHIHLGAADASGAVKVAFKKSAEGAWKGCATADKALLNDIMRSPGNFYVNVHNAEFPNGAVRGQLGK